MSEESLNCLSKIPVVSEVNIDSYSWYRSIDRYCFRIDIRMGSRSQKVLDD